MASGWSKSGEWGEPRTKNTPKPKNDTFRPILSRQEEEELFGEFMRRRGEIKADERNLPLCIWFEGAGCGGEMMTLLEIEREYPLRCVYLPSLMTAWGEKAYAQLTDTVKSRKPYFLLVSGGIPVGREEQNQLVSRWQGRIISAEELLKRLVRGAAQVICLGTCACYGGIGAYRQEETVLPIPALTGGRKTLLLPGCPVEAAHLELILQGLTEGKPLPTDEKGLPAWWGKQTLHQRCGNRGCFEKGHHAKSIQESGCRQELGCRGMTSICPRGQYQPNCVSVGGRCWGCTEKDFPKGR